MFSNEQEYRAQVDKNLIALKQTQEKNAKTLLKLEWLIGSFSIAIFLVFALFATLLLMPLFCCIILYVIGLILFFVGIFCRLFIEKDAGFYECEGCKFKYVPTY